MHGIRQQYENISTMSQLGCEENTKYRLHRRSKPSEFVNSRRHDCDNFEYFRIEEGYIFDLKVRTKKTTKIWDKILEGSLEGSCRTLTFKTLHRFVTRFTCKICELV
jgi:hypothetical protein